MTRRPADAAFPPQPLADLPAEPPHSLRVESHALYAALFSGIFGAVAGFIVANTNAPLPLYGDLSFGTIDAALAAAVAAVAGTIGYWRSRGLPGQEWRDALSSRTFTINAIAVVLVHVVLAAVSVLVAFLVLSRGFIGLAVAPFWAIVLMAVTLGLTAQLTYLSASRMTTQRMSSLLMSFVVVGTLTAMVSSPDPEWWKLHFSQLGTFWSLSSLMFNGTLVAGGLLVTAFAVSLQNDMSALVRQGALANPKSPAIISTMFIIMGALLAGVGLVPVNVNMLIHNVCASGMALMFIGMLVGGHWMVRGMPQVYFTAAWMFLAAVIGSTALFAVGYFGLTAFEIVVFALIFGWIAVFIRFLGVAGPSEQNPSRLPHRGPDIIRPEASSITPVTRKPTGSKIANRDRA